MASNSPILPTDSVPKNTSTTGKKTGHLNSKIEQIGIRTQDLSNQQISDVVANTSLSWRHNQLGHLSCSYGNVSSVGIRKLDRAKRIRTAWSRISCLVSFVISIILLYCTFSSKLLRSLRRLRPIFFWGLYTEPERICIVLPVVRDSVCFFYTVNTPTQQKTWRNSIIYNFAFGGHTLLRRIFQGKNVYRSSQA